MDTSHNGREEAPIRGRLRGSAGWMRVFELCTEDEP